MYEKILVIVTPNKTKIEVYFAKKYFIQKADYGPTFYS